MSLSSLLGSKRHNYDLADQDEEIAEIKRPQPQSFWHRYKLGLVARILTLVVVLAGWTYFVGSNSYHSGVKRMASEYQHQNIDVNMVHRTFHFDKSFPSPPTSNHIHTDYPWANLYPKFGPYFNKSATDPERWTFAVFHQLHCVNRLRHGYWKAHTAALEGRPLGDEDNSRMISPEHIQHCIDYLRQSLMCHGDTTLEPDDVGINGAHGFGVQHNCKSWSQLLHQTNRRVLGHWD